MTEYLPGAAWRPIAYRADAGSFPATPLGWVLHVVVGDGSPWGGFATAQGSKRRFSTAWVAKDGHSEQYVELSGKSWAQAAGNGTYWSFETEGFPGEALTDAQIDTLARWHVYLGTPDLIADAPGQRGIGTHVMGGAAWGGHTCPGPGPRAGQRAAIIARARALRNPNPAPAPIHQSQEDDAMDILIAIYLELVGRMPDAPGAAYFLREVAVGRQSWAQVEADIAAGPESQAFAALGSEDARNAQRAAAAASAGWPVGAR